MKRKYVCPEVDYMGLLPDGSVLFETHSHIGNGIQLSKKNNIMISDNDDGWLWGDDEDSEYEDENESEW